LFVYSITLRTDSVQRVSLIIMQKPQGVDCDALPSVSKKKLTAKHGIMTGKREVCAVLHRSGHGLGINRSMNFFIA
jgi:hypothetical protein